MYLALLRQKVRPHIIPKHKFGLTLIDERATLPQLLSPSLFECRVDFIRIAFCFVHLAGLSMGRARINQLPTQSKISALPTAQATLLKMRVFMLSGLMVGVLSLYATPGCSPGDPSPFDPSFGTGGVFTNGSGGMEAGSGGAEPGSGGAAQPDCSGEFSNPQPLLVGGRMTSPAITGDELELYYVSGEAYYEQIYVSRRSSTNQAFDLGTPVDELNEICDGLNASLDVSYDGLRLYLSCYLDVDQLAPLLMLTRPDRDSAYGSPFELGLFTTSAGLSADELSVYGARFNSDVATRLATRLSPTAPFDASLSAPGLDQTALFSPGISPDGLELYGAVGMEKIFSVARRASVDLPFNAPQPLPQLSGSYIAVGAADISQDCRSIIYAAVITETEWTLLRAERAAP